MYEIKDIRELQMLELLIAKEIKRICIQNNIRYFLVGGTLLGAIRHEGFIPWDDDMDIGMTLDEWKKFIICAKEQMRDEFYLDIWDDKTSFGYPFAKMRLKDTVVWELSANNANRKCGIWVDVFPYIPTSKKKLKTNLFKLQTIAKQYLLRQGYKVNEITRNPIGKMWNNVLLIVSLPFSKKVIKKYYEKILKNIIVDEPEYYLERDGRFKGNFTFEKNIFDRLIERKFEDTTFLIPSGYERYLMKAYGDYMKIPPKAERDRGHSLMQVYLNKKYSDFFLEGDNI